MNLANLTDAELGRVVRESPLWPILLEMEHKQKTAGEVEAPAAKEATRYEQPTS